MLDAEAYGELYRLACMGAAFCAAAYYDWRTGYVSEKIWLIAGLAAAPAYLMHPPSAGTAWIMLIGTLVALACWASRLYAAGDFEALLALAILLPVLGGIPVLLPVLLGAAALSFLGAAVANPVLNMRRCQKGKKIFSDVQGSGIKKAIALFLVHPYKSGEIHAYCSEAGSGPQRRLALMSLRRMRHVDEFPVSEGTYVGLAIPMLVPLAASLVAVSAAILLAGYAGAVP